MSSIMVAGVETEYGIIGKDVHGIDPIAASYLVVDAYHRLGLPWVPCASLGIIPPDASAAATAASTGSMMLANGARYYVDHAHPEYSTPECRTARAVLAADKAGERVLDSCRRMAERSGHPVAIYKNNTDYKGNSYGCHENYLVPAEGFQRLLSRDPGWLFGLLLPFLITRSVVTGAGKVGSENGRAPTGFQLTQRADFMETLIGPQTTHHRPLFNTRHEPHAPADRFGRLHVIIGDANMAEHSGYLKVGSTMLVLKAMTRGILQSDFTLRDPLQSFMAISRDLTLTEPLALASGGTMTALALQRRFADAAERCLEVSDDATNDDWDVLSEWHEVLDELETGWETQCHRLDWAIKRRLFERFLNKQGIDGWDEVAAWQPIIEATQRYPNGHARARDAASERGVSWADYDRNREAYFSLRALELEYHEIRGLDSDEDEVGLATALQSSGVISRVLNDAEIERALDWPPNDTRAWLRGGAIRSHSPSIARADWEVVETRLGKSGPAAIIFPDPSAGSTVRINGADQPCSDIAQLMADLLKARAD